MHGELFADKQDELVQLVADLATEFDQTLSQEPTPQTLRTRWSNADEHVRRRFPAAHALALKTWQQIELQGHMYRLRQLLAERVNPVLVGHGHPVDAVNEFWPAEAISLFAFAVANSYTSNVAAATFPALLERRAAAWQSSVIAHRLLVPIHWLSAHSTVPLSEDGKVSLTRFDAHRSFMVGMDDSNPPDPGMWPPVAALEGNCTISKAEDARLKFPFPEMEEAARWVISLRLASGHAFASPFACVVPTVDYLGITGVTGSWQFTHQELLPASWRRQDYFALTQAHIASARAFFADLPHVKEATKFGLHRFNLSSSRQLLEDELLDLAIALEATLLVGTKDELKFRLAQRGALLLQSQFPAQETADFLAGMYNVRSSIVHDGRTIKDAKWKDRSGLAGDVFVSRLRQLVTAVLREYVRHGRSKSDAERLAAALDRAALRSVFDISVDLSVAKA